MASAASSALEKRYGIKKGGNQVAVSVRGTCARAARPIYAQEAGAAAAIMITIGCTANGRDVLMARAAVTTAPV